MLRERDLENFILILGDVITGAMISRGVNIDEWGDKQQAWTADIGLRVYMVLEALGYDINSASQDDLEYVDSLLAGKWTSMWPGIKDQMTTLRRVAKGNPEPSPIPPYEVEYAKTHNDVDYFHIKQGNNRFWGPRPRAEADEFCAKLEQHRKFLETELRAPVFR